MNSGYELKRSRNGTVLLIEKVCLCNEDGCNGNSLFPKTTTESAFQSTTLTETSSLKTWTSNENPPLKFNHGLKIMLFLVCVANHEIKT